MDHTAREAYHKMRRDLEAFQGYLIDADILDKMEEIIYENIKDLEWDQYLQVYRALPEHGDLKDMVYAVRTRIVDERMKADMENTPPPIPKSSSKSEDEKERERLYKAQEEFFFPTKKHNTKCDCGAVHTSFPNDHADYCSTQQKPEKASWDKKINDDDWDGWF